MAHPMPHVIPASPRSARTAPPPRRVPPRLAGDTARRPPDPAIPYASAPMTAEEADLAARVTAYYAAHPKPRANRQIRTAAEPRREAGAEDIAVVARDAEGVPLAAFDLSVLPADDDGPGAADAQPVAKPVKWMIASRRARFKASARSLTAWLTTLVIVVAVLGGATVVLFGPQRSIAIATAASAHASAIVNTVTGLVGLR